MIKVRAREFKQIKNTVRSREKRTRFFMWTDFAFSVLSSHGFAPSPLRPSVSLSLSVFARPRGPTSASLLLLRRGPRSPLASYLPASLARSATPADSCRHPRERPSEIDIYEVRWLVTSLYATFGHSGHSDSIFQFFELIFLCGSSVRKIISV